MLEKKKSISTVGIYTRSLRTIFNKAISDGIIPNDLYPFGRHKYQTPTALNVKKALSLEDIKKIYDYKAPPGTMKEQARDMWLFSYIANGINPKDIAWLKYSNIKDDKIVLIRQKTIRTERTQLDAPVKLTTVRRFKLTTLNFTLSMTKDGQLAPALSGQCVRFFQYGLELIEKLLEKC